MRSSTLKGRIVPDIPFNLRVPALSSPTGGVHHASIFMLQEVNPAGAPADGSDGSGVQGLSADVSGISSSGVAPSDGLLANDLWHNQARQLPVPAGQPAAFAPRSRPTTPFGTPQ
eukprot:6950427-Pyramimonas_sp.AAC.2